MSESSPSLVFPVERRDSALVITPSSDLREFAFDRIEEAADGIFQELSRGSLKNIVFDFRKTDYYGSTALGFFVKLWKHVKAAGGEMAFCNVSHHEREILVMTHLHTLWPIFDSLDQALQAVSKRT